MSNSITLESPVGTRIIMTRDEKSFSFVFCDKDTFVVCGEERERLICWAAKNILVSESLASLTVVADKGVICFDFNPLGAVSYNDEGDEHCLIIEAFLKQNKGEVALIFRGLFRGHAALKFFALAENE